MQNVILTVQLHDRAGTQLLRRKSEMNLSKVGERAGGIAQDLATFYRQEQRKQAKIAAQDNEEGEKQ